MRRIIIINHPNPFAKGGGSYATRAYMKDFYRQLFIGNN